MTAQLTFNHITLTPISQPDDQIWITSTDLSKALGYADEKSINRVYARNLDEFTEQMSMVVNLTVNRNSEGVNLTPSVKLTDQRGTTREMRIFSLRGAHLVAMFARTQVAKDFRKWVLDILEKETTTHTPSINVRNILLEGYTKPNLTLPDDIQKALDNKLWDLTHEAHDLIHEHLLRRVAWWAEGGYPKKTLDKKKALEALNQGGLDDALVHPWRLKMDLMESQARRFVLAGKELLKDLEALKKPEPK